MKRDILFRAKRVDNGNWVEGSLLRYFVPDKPQIILIVDWKGNQFDVDSNTIGQFTGLFDNEGSRIFEGDIVKVNHIESDVKYEWREFTAWNDNECDDPLNYIEELIEIKGNIYDKNTNE